MKDISMKTMRDALIEQIYKKMFDDEMIFFLSADLGSPVLDKVREKFEERFINVGIAEQNLINVSTGLAFEGYTVYAYALAPFITMRAYEQLRVNLSISAELMDLNVNLIGVGAGLSYDVSGPTHHCIEDIIIMRALPNFITISPSDCKIAESLVDYTIDVKKPKYIRLDAKPLPQIYNKTDNFNLENGFCELIEGEKICLVTTGNMTHNALNASKRLQENKINVGVLDMIILKPVREELLFNFLKKYECIITIEEGFINKGGLDSLILDILNKYQLGIRLEKLGFDDKYVFDLGGRNHLHTMNNLDEESIIKIVKENLNRF
ncbi:MAG: transketolase [Candidatus Scalindua sp.]|jgi:transketolase|nr:transketolase [Candidatus Scalindua sp.]MBT5307334.1 transketolase [Candidatus Scalindua sp.]MBT6563182.1 transketolase [Candidatus Scalindua sp.]MBT7212486.1 transketolase [Candidatus Scalindua sp.]MBT7591092.1 transketolase [Candidatus Scalindua sp.]